MGFVLTKEYMESFAEPCMEDVVKEIQARCIRVKVTNGKWYLAPVKDSSKYVLDCEGNYLVLCEITEDGRCAGKVKSDRPINKDTVVEEKDDIDVRRYRMKDGRSVFVSADSNGEYHFTKEHTMATLYPMAEYEKD